MNRPSIGGKIKTNNPNQTSSRKASAFLPNIWVIIVTATLDEEDIKEMGYGGGPVGACDPSILCCDTNMDFKSSDIP